MENHVQPNLSWQITARLDIFLAILTAWYMAILNKIEEMQFQTTTQPQYPVLCWILSHDLLLFIQLLLVIINNTPPTYTCWMQHFPDRSVGLFHRHCGKLRKSVTVVKENEAILGKTKNQIAALHQQIRSGIHHKHHKLITVWENIFPPGFSFLMWQKLVWSLISFCKCQQFSPSSIILKQRTATVPIK